MNRRLAWYWLGPLLLAVGLYAVTVPGTYIYDDELVAKEDPRLHEPRLWGQFWTQGYYQDSVDNPWRPIVSMTMAVQAWAHPGAAWPFHLVNVLLHGVASAMVAGLGARLAGRRVGMIAGLLFAAHPVHVEAVAGIVGRAEAMVTIGIVGALLTLIGRRMTVGRAVGITAWFLFAALCKEQGILVPAMVAAWFALRRWREPAAEATEARANQWLLVLMTGTLAAYVSYRNHVAPWFWERGFLDESLNPLIRSVGADRWLILLAILGRYVGLLVAPYRLAIDYSAGVFTARVHWGEPWIYVGAVALVAYGVLLAVAWRRRWAAAAFCLVCFGLVYLMVGNLLLIGTVFAERLMYVPSAFFCVLAGLGLARLRGRALAGAIVVVLGLASWRVVTYAWRWNDPMRLFAYEYEVQPRAANINRLMGKAFEDAGDVEAAALVYAHARAVAPESFSVWIDSARLEAKRGNFDEAAGYAKRAMKLHPTVSTAQVWTDVMEAKRRAAATTRPGGRE